MDLSLKLENTTNFTLHADIIIIASTFKYVYIALWFSVSSSYIHCIAVV